MYMYGGKWPSLREGCGGKSKGRDGESNMDQFDVQDAKLSLKMV